MLVMQAYRYALDLSPAQQRVVAAHAGAARFAYNWALARVKAVLDQRAACGLVLDRDHNAALNLAALAAQFDTAGSGPVAARGADRKTQLAGQVAVKREPGPTPVGQTGTVAPQGGTTDRVLTEAH
jgi:hypothetical protein